MRKNIENIVKESSLNFVTWMHQTHPKLFHELLVEFKGEEE